MAEEEKTIPETEETVAEETLVEEAVVEETPAEEVVEETPAEEQLSEEEVVEEPVVEEAVVEETSEEATESLKKDEDVLVESLSVIKEVRSELAGAYKTNKELSTTVESLSTELNALKEKYGEAEKTIESLSSELDVFKQKEAEVVKSQFNARLEQLSAKFEALGRPKTVEQLSSLSEDAIVEFETITEMALDKQREESLSEPATVPTAALNKPVQVAVPVRSVEQMSTREVLFGVIENLKAQQNSSGGEARRTISL